MFEDWNASKEMIMIKCNKIKNKTRIPLIIKNFPRGTREYEYHDNKSDTKTWYIEYETISLKDIKFSDDTPDVFENELFILSLPKKAIKSAWKNARVKDNNGKEIIIDQLTSLTLKLILYKRNMRTYVFKNVKVVELNA